MVAGQHSETTAALMLAARNISERDRTVDDWQDALLVVTSTDKWLNAKDGAASTGRQKKQSSWPNKQTVSAMAAPQPSTASDEEGSTQSDEGRQEGAQAAVVPAQRSKGKRNPHLSSDQLTQLLAKKPHVCLQCYKPGHYSRECRKPANRAPTEAELKARPASRERDTEPATNTALLTSILTHSTSSSSSSHGSDRTAGRQAAATSGGEASGERKQQKNSSSSSSSCSPV